MATSDLLCTFSFLLGSLLSVSGLGSMSSIAICYGEEGCVFCGLRSDGSHSVNCCRSNSTIVYGTPTHFPLLGPTAGTWGRCKLVSNGLKSKMAQERNMEKNKAPNGSQLDSNKKAMTICAAIDTHIEKSFQ
ncbi:uncharacterized protein LOC129290426 isoform X2 [Prosopis cineraria]|uniref:uncharacterized protein LOC129290426 isoform X2 n=1 Tax=Prosopis cineraria TaxID=364024 RepID=UPI00240EB06C|nr:uncharacterized protein LOC129290426 isoform X2 [Prosopis cineraria]